MGRPPKDVKRDHIVSVRLTKAEYDALAERARENGDGLKVSDLARDLMMRGAGPLSLFGYLNLLICPLVRDSDVCPWCGEAKTQGKGLLCDSCAAQPERPGEFFFLQAELEIAYRIIDHPEIMLLTMLDRERIKAPRPPPEQPDNPSSGREQEDIQPKHGDDIGFPWYELGG